MGLVGMVVNTGCMFLPWGLLSILKTCLVRSLRPKNASDHLYPEQAMAPCIQCMEMLYA